MKVCSYSTMKLLCYADLQATDGDALCFTQPNVMLQHYRVARFFDDLSRIYREHGCAGVIDLGDTTDDRSSIPWPTVEALGAGMAKIPKGDHWKLTGNHEQYLRDISVNNRRLFDHTFKVVDDRRIQGMGDWTAFFVSYPASYLEVAEWLLRELPRFRGPKLLFGHFQVEGAFFNNSTALTGVPKSVLQKFNLVMLGHIHIPQSVTPKIHYVGSPFQQDWGEANQSKRVGIVDTNQMTVEWVPLTGYPEYRAVSFAEFAKVADEVSEHRYKVTLSSHEETESFFRHPRFNRATAIYSYDETPVQPGAEIKDWTFEGMCRRYLQTVPPSNNGIDLSDAEMLDVTAHLLKP